MKKTGLKRSLVVFLTLCLAVSIFVLCGYLLKEKDLNKTQREALETLAEDIGTYDDKTLVLNYTSHSFAKELAKKLGAKLRITSDGGYATLTLQDGRTVRDVYEDKANRALLKKLSLDYKVTLAENDAATDDGDAEADITDKFLVSPPNYEVTDPYYDRQPALNYINLQDTWQKTKGKNKDGEKVTVAIIDTGIDYDHPEFIDADGKTIISEWSYYVTEDKIVKDYVLEDGSYNWEIIQDQDNEVHGAYHGTLVAGVIAAQMNNGIGITGIAPDVELLVIKIKMNDDGTFNTSDCIFGLYYAIERDADVVNMSLGGGSESDWIAPVKLAYESDVICVASAGNEGSSSPTYPAACEHVIAVGALAENSWTKAEYSNYGDWVDVFAPEVNYSTTNGGYDSFSGTSSSAPVVAAALALYKTQNKYVEFDVLYETLIASNKDLGDPGPDFYYGWGGLDINALIWEEKGTVTFDYLTDEIDSTTQIFVRGHALQNIPEPERLYAAFDGWFYDIHCEDENEINYYTDIWQDDLTLYAKWINEDEGSVWIYTKLDDGTIELNSYTGKRRFITVPESLEGLPVSSIGSGCFAYNSRLRQVTLPSTLKYIKSIAFKNCYNLLTVTIPESVISIGENAFESCSKLYL